MNIIYCATIRLPTEKAHGLQIMKTSAAMVQAGAKLELVIPDRDNAITTDPFDYYHTPKNFLITIPVLVFLGIGYKVIYLFEQFFVKNTRHQYGIPVISPWRIGSRKLIDHYFMKFIVYPRDQHGCINKPGKGVEELLLLVMDYEKN